MTYLQVDIVPTPSVTLVTVTGVVDLATIAQFRERVDSLPDRDTVVEMSDLALLCAAGLPVLRGLEDRLTAVGARLVLAAPSALVRRVLAITGLDARLLMAPTLDDALTLLGVRHGAAVGVRVRAGAPTAGPPWAEGAASTAKVDQVEAFPSPFRLQAYRAVSAVVSDDHNFERGVESARAIAHMVLAEHGPDGLVEVAVELSLKLAEALERIAAEQGLTATDVADVLFVD